MTTGDKVVVLLGVKAVCCGLLVLGAAGLLGGVTAWFVAGPGRWVVLGAVVALMAWVIVGQRQHTATSQIEDQEKRDAGRDRQNEHRERLHTRLVRPIQTLDKDVEQLSCGASQPTDRMT